MSGPAASQFAPNAEILLAARAQATCATYLLACSRSKRLGPVTQLNIIASGGTLPNAGFYQAAAALLGVLLLTGVVTEVRTTRDQSAGSWGRISGVGAASTVFSVCPLSSSQES